jgi:hypothetical protein
MAYAVGVLSVNSSDASSKKFQTWDFAGGLCRDFSSSFAGDRLAALLEMTLTALLQTIFFSWDRCEHHQVKKPVAIPPPQGNTIPSRFAELYFRTFNHNLASPQ